MNPEILKHFSSDQKFFKVQSLSESFISPLSELIRFAAFGAAISPYENSEPKNTISSILREVNYRAAASEEVYEKAHGKGVSLHSQIAQYAKDRPVISIPIVIDEVSPKNASFAFDLADFTFTQGFMKNFVSEDSNIRKLRGRENIVALCYQQLLNALNDFRLEKRTPENYVEGIKQVTDGINILAATIKDPGKVIVYDSTPFDSP
ncbi:hypothetical protein ACFOOP_02260 [Marinicaulis aureus]|uniref:Uncharacterized protein n=1 Tax=Hyphococcus aureus TaxID=2666033 RepID=A0ABW1KU28_9PROT